MTPASRFLARVRRRLSALQPEAASAYLRGLRILVEWAGARDVERAVSVAYSTARVGGAHLLQTALDDALRPLMTDEVVDAAFSRFRAVTQGAVGDGVMYFARDVPGAQRFDVNVNFGVLQPRVVEAIRTMDDRVTARLHEDVRASYRGIMEQAYADGVGPRQAAKRVRHLLGLSPSELQQVENFRAALEGRDGRDWRAYTARDKRFDRTIAKAMRGSGLPPERVDAMVEAYARKRLALSAESHARTTMLNASKQAQQASWQSAVDGGIIDGSLLWKEWITVGDSRVRPDHVEMRGETAPFDQPYSNGQVVPGESDWNCRCWSRIFARSR